MDVMLLDVSVRLLAYAIRYHRLERVHVRAEGPQAHLLDLAAVDEMRVGIAPCSWQFVRVVGVRKNSEGA